MLLRTGAEMLPAPDIPLVLGTLAAHEVAFVVVGGVAVAYHGYVRATKDVDIVPRPTEENLRRLWDALLEMEARPLSLGDFTLAVLVDLGNWDLATRYGRVDVLQYVAGKLETRDDYDGLARRADESHFDFGAVLVAGYDDLIDLENLAGREQDLIDIRALREARGDIGPG